MSWVLFDMIYVMRDCVFADLHKSLKYDASWRITSHQLIQDYSYYAELFAYKRYNRINNPSCAICLNEFGKEPPYFH